MVINPAPPVEGNNRGSRRSLEAAGDDKDALGPGDRGPRWTIQGPTTNRSWGKGTEALGPGNPRSVLYMSRCNEGHLEAPGTKGPVGFQSWKVDHAGPWECRALSPGDRG